jgi:hypothetical protein
MMGACFNTVYFEETDKKVVSDRFEDIIEQDRYENGHSYSGSIGMCDGFKFSDTLFDSELSAEEWLEENARKWGPAIGVRIKNNVQDGWLFGAWCSS